MALPAALAAMCVLAALAALAQLTARVAIRESSALVSEAQAEAGRETLRARAKLALNRTPRGTITAAPVRVGGGDTTLRVAELAWPWHLVGVAANGEALIAEVARASVPDAWCAAIASGGVVAVAPGTARLSATSSCVQVLVAVDTASVTALVDQVSRDLALDSLADTVRISTSAASPLVVRAARRVTLAPGASVSGLVIAPHVRIETGAVVTGLVVSADTVVVLAGATVTGDERVVVDALRAAARLRLLGRRGLLALPNR